MLPREIGAGYLAKRSIMVASGVTSMANFASIIPMKTSLFLSALLVANIGMVNPVFAAPDCTCRNNGIDVPEGKTSCLQTSSGPKIAKCSRVLNNTSWKITNVPCTVG